jgi:phenylacetic acid degradation operon negative regulatory protein
LGYAALDETTWIAPRASDEALALLAAEGVDAEAFTARHDGNSARLVARAWDLDALAAAYDDWLCVARRISAVARGDPADEVAFAVRSTLVHEWRKFLFRDPGLPRGLLPQPWPGQRAAAYFDRESARLLPAANRFVDTCLSPGGGPLAGPIEEALPAYDAV